MSSTGSNITQRTQDTFRIRIEYHAGGRMFSPQRNANIKLHRLRRLSKTNNETEFPDDQGLNLANWKI